MGAEPYKSEWITSKGLVDVAAEGKNGNLWAFALKQEGQEE
jgi:hypothetical protein